jgi:spoIIIJ-associated protein
MALEKSGEFRGKSVEAAINTGLTALGLGRDEVEVEVLRSGSRGLLGIGAEDAVVRLTALAAGGFAEPSTAAPRVEQAPRTEPTPARNEPPPAARGQSRQGGRQEQSGRPDSRQSGRRVNRQRSDAPRSTGASTMTAGTAGQPSPDLDAIADPNEREAMQMGRDILLGLLQRMGLDVQVEVVPQSEAEKDEDEESSMVLNILGDDLGMLIGRQSETLQALQFITRLMVNQQTHSRTDVIVDVNGYKAKRAESLRKLALRTADQVVQTGRTMALEPMQPFERRIIHLALRNHPSVTTESVGEAAKRKVTVIPNK